MLTMKKTRQHRLVDYTLGMCFLCNGVQDFGHEDTKRELLKCFDCHRNVHPQCCELDKISAEIVQTYDWQCNDCKSCLVCQSKNDESKIVICNRCDRGYHTFCCNPPLKYIPKDDWYCEQCSDNQHKIGYSLRQSPSHSAKYIESKTMSEDIPKRKYVKQKSEEVKADKKNEEDQNN
ncbi:uncharacterized protein BX663DRAFT_250263 [Cokeromyces recurvatus]|uniref:uncharacterized protein n=1 Tax=Cokeromyces recurvatus TaxID=90255 RepID=UPI00221F2284|nr:uncharacterized protein BX663DRAFT_250263 [Cokeromyces recurvatus]KAI7906060.1 hypothetical protein BX663DRAFT_250263 [Cokeromyces recurvatus]